MICKWSTVIFCFMIQVVCKQNGPNLEYRHARLKDGYYALCSVSWEQRPDNRLQRERSGHEEHRWWMEDGGGRARSLAGAGQVINCEITPHWAGSVQTDLWPGQTRNKSYTTGNAGNTQQGCFCPARKFCFASVFSKIKAKKNFFSKRLVTTGERWCTGQKFVLNKSSDLLGY